MKLPCFMPASIVAMYAVVSAAIMLPVLFSGCTVTDGTQTPERAPAAVSPKIETTQASIGLVLKEANDARYSHDAYRQFEDKWRDRPIQLSGFVTGATVNRDSWQINVSDSVLAGKRGEYLTVFFTPREFERAPGDGFRITFECRITYIGPGSLLADSEARYKQTHK